MTTPPFVKFPQWRKALVACGLGWACSWSAAEITAIVAVEPTAKKAAHTILRSAMEASLGKAAGQTASVTVSDDLADVMRATRSGGYDVFIGPAQVAASALDRGYELVGANHKSQKYVLVAAPTAAAVGELKGGRLYLPQQDSIYTYMARGMLNEAGLSFKDLKQVQYEKYPQAGLTALVLGSTDATVVREDDWAEWSAAQPKAAKVLASSQPVPGGFTVVVKKELPAELRSRVAQWFTSASEPAGLAPATLKPEAAQYKRVAELGLFTPVALPGVQRVNAKEAQQLQGQGALLVDTRTEKEFRAKRMKGAVWAPYIEKSLKDVAFDPAADDFSALGKLPAKPMVFACNGAECWKSYKAAKHAAAKGHKNVYWLRGGLPEWAAEGLPTEKD